MEIVHVYQKKRREFGRQCVFSDRKAKEMVNIEPDEGQRDEFIYKNPADVAIQCTKDFSEHEVNTETVEFKDSGMNHVEGGWPKDIDPDEVEQVMRYRKKVEKDETFQETIMNLGGMMETFIQQNNAIDIYEEYFPHESETAVLEPPAATMVNVFRDPCTPARSASSLSWYPDGARKLAVAYSILEFQKAPADVSMDSYVWDLERPNMPDFTLSPSSPLVSLRYNPKDVHILLGGCYNGQVAIWDTRKGSRPLETSPVEQSHRDPVYAAEFLASKTGTHTCTHTYTRSLRRVKWCDTRKLSESTESLALEVIGSVLGGVALDLSHPCTPLHAQLPRTHTVIGTEEGIVINGNKKAKTPAEKLAQTYGAHHGPVYTVKRNPFFQKYFMTVGDWTSRIWCEDVREDPIGEAEENFWQNVDPEKWSEMRLARDSVANAATTGDAAAAE
ncbi:dynein intermediate chain 2 [Salpingoeca rosetta]|uniref:Dynein intermediate chain 2 n=1 Tax=Salpingoeca rosetta (strain ATCC 50818 / BSB-021) TaxID=946362 RepID=F2U6F2_SALR5|nr:dynein intermediate chain 2 [Salpingoeca rosetta]EGD83093.1 dynein intermediate chain 2 [Salpingoeca rosetta]|eukprot:XP_004995457.1 dynein intermediate chain 2 [Salpingoeca rosetta]